jgi:cobyrinic acid a,c-diamide synthase
MAALRSRGVRVAAAKVGPDFIDPSYHRLATGRSSRSLDTFLSAPALVPSLAARAGSGSDILVIEGVMGLFDGAYEPHRAGSGGEQETGAPRLAVASTAAVAALTRTPVVLVVDASSLSQSVAALVHGYATWSPEVPVLGVILNRVGSDAHEDGLRRALEPVRIPILGVLRREDGFAWRDRHLGLIPVAERPTEIQASLSVLADAVERSIDLDAVARLAATAPRGETPPLPSLDRRESHSSRPRIAVAGGPAFTFVYPDNLERFEEAGAELVPLDPTRDKGLPTRSDGSVGIDGMYAGGGFPEVYADELSTNLPMLEGVAAAAALGVPMWAECGGLLWLAAALDGRALCGVVPTTAQMTRRLTLGYRTATVRRSNPVAPVGATLKGHEFHYSQVDPPGDALSFANHHDTWLEGFATSSVLATYLHLHLGTDPAPAERFVTAAATWRHLHDRGNGRRRATS